MNPTGRNIAFDVIKGIAIIAVVLYHFGVCDSCYLGVDVFLVIAGYMTAKSLWKSADKSIRSGAGWLKDRLIRMLPLLLIAELILLLYGLLLMMPDDYENLAQSVVASNVFANNILAEMTIKSYWNVANAYRPLMHTWFLGVLMQAYIIFVVCDVIIGRFRGKRPGAYIAFWAILSAISLFLYLSGGNHGSKYYLIQYRIFEFGIGSLVFYLQAKFGRKTEGALGSAAIIVAYAGLLIMLFTNLIDLKMRYMVVLADILTAVLAYLLPLSAFSGNRVFFNKPLAIIGSASFSIYIWYQIVTAVGRYSFTDDFKFWQCIIILLIIGVLAWLSYRYIEKARIGRKGIIMLGSMFVLINIGALTVYARAGVFFDIPELEVTKGNAQTQMWAAYCDGAYQFEKPFDENGKPKWMVVGNSFGRDFVNIIRESEIADSINISYAYDYYSDEYAERIHCADIVFVANSGLSEEFVNGIKALMRDGARIVIVGEKNLGECNGQVFRNRNKRDYLQSTIAMRPGYDERNEEFKRIYGDDFIDLIDMVKQPDGRVRVFTDDGLFISQDCLHLTRAGARFFAGRINWNNFF